MTLTQPALTLMLTTHPHSRVSSRQSTKEAPYGHRTKKKWKGWGAGRTGKEKTKMSSRFCLKQTAERYLLPQTVECLKTSVVSAFTLRTDKQNAWKVCLMDVKFVISMALPNSHTMCLWVPSKAGKFSRSLRRPDKTEHKPLTWRPERGKSEKLTLRREIAIPAEGVYC